MLWVAYMLSIFWAVPSTSENLQLQAPKWCCWCHTGTSHHCTFQRSHGCLQPLCRWAIGWQAVYIWSWRRHEAKHCSLSKDTGMTFQVGGISVYKFRVQKNYHIGIIGIEWCGQNWIPCGSYLGETSVCDHSGWGRLLANKSFPRSHI